MSYSYVKTVFPNFQFSNVYNDKLYTNTSSTITNTKPSGLTDNSRIETYKQIEPYQEPYQEPYKEPYKEPYQEPYQESYQKPYQEPYKEQYKNNLTYYNKPVLNQDIPNYDNIDKEKFESIPKNDKNILHENYISHINNCPSCKEELLKQFNIETERLKNDEIMELISYIIFGIFVLILLDSFKK